MKGSFMPISSCDAKDLIPTLIKPNGIYKLERICQPQDIQIVIRADGILSIADLAQLYQRQHDDVLMLFEKLTHLGVFAILTRQGQTYLPPITDKADTIEAIAVNADKADTIEAIAVNADKADTIEAIAVNADRDDTIEANIVNADRDDTLEANAVNADKVDAVELETTGEDDYSYEIMDSISSDDLVIHSASMEQDCYVRDNDLPTAISELMTAFARVAACFRLYDLRNDAVQRAIADLYRNIKSVLCSAEQISLQVEPWRFLYGKHEVYRNDDREHSLSFKLFRDGVREITLRDGIDWEELSQLIEIFSSVSNLSQGAWEDDIVTLFWRKDFSHIELVAVEGFTLNQPNKEEKNSFHAHLQRLRAQGDESGVGRSSLIARDPLRRFMDILNKIKREEELYKFLQDMCQKQPSYREIKRSVAQGKQDEDLASVMLEQHTELFLQWFEANSTNFGAALRDEHLLCVMEGYRDQLAVKGQMQSLVSFAHQMQNWSERNTPDLLQRVGRAWIQSLMTEPVLKKLLAGLSLILPTPDAPIPSAVIELLTWAEHDPTQTLLEILGTHQGSRLRQVVRRILIQLHRGQCEPFVKYLHQVGPEICVQIVKCLQILNTQEAKKAITSLLHHQDPDIQQIILSMTEDLFTSQEEIKIVRDLITALLNSAQESERIRAYHLIERSRDSRWTNFLLRCLQEDRAYSRQELQVIVKLTAKLNAQVALPAFLKIAEPAGRFSVEGSHRKLLREIALDALVYIGGAKAEASIRRLLEQSRGELHSKCIDAMRELRRREQGLYQSLDAISEIQLAQAQSQREHKLSNSRLYASHPSLDDISTSLDHPDVCEQDPEIQQLQNHLMQKLHHLDLRRANAHAETLRAVGEKFLLNFQMLIKTAKLYAESNSIYDRPIAEISALLNRLFEHHQEIHLLEVDGQFYLNDVRVRMGGESMQQVASGLAGIFHNLGLGGLIFRASPTEQQWRSLFRMLAAERSAHNKTGWLQIQRDLQASDMATLLEICGPIAYRVSNNPDIAPKTFCDIYKQALEICYAIWQPSRAGQYPTIAPLRRLLQQIIDYIANNPHPSLEPLLIDDPDLPMITHSVRTAVLALLTGHQIGLPHNDLVELGLIALLHDIGYMTAYVYSHNPMSQWFKLHHSEAAIGLMLRQSDFHPTKIQRMLLTLYHNTISYIPESMKQNLLFRILQVVDFYDTATSSWTDHSPLTPDQALAHLNTSTNTIFDLIAVQALINCMGLFPVGCILELGDGSLAISLGHDGQPQHFQQPRALPIYDRLGKDVDLPILDPVPTSGPSSIRRVQQRHLTPAMRKILLNRLILKEN
jgi:HD-GYP domain-containing protein (c-di-GMP phosphodiesterase class II)